MIFYKKYMKKYNSTETHTRARECPKPRRRVESEKTLERNLKVGVQMMGGLALKFTSQFHRGIPDRLVLMPGGRAYWAEIKTTGKKPTRLQVLAMEELEKLGFPCRVIDSTESLKNFLHEVQSSQLPDQSCTAHP